MSDVSLADAAKAVGKSAVTLRALVNNGKLKSYMKGRAHFVNLNDVTALFASRSPSAQRSGASASEASEQALLNALQAQLRASEFSLQRERQINDSLREEISGLRSELLKMMSEMKALLQKEDKGLLSRWIRG